MPPSEIAPSKGGGVGVGGAEGAAAAGGSAGGSAKATALAREAAANSAKDESIDRTCTAGWDALTRDEAQAGILAAVPPCRALLHLLSVAAWRTFFATFGVVVPKSVRDVDALALFLAEMKLSPTAARALSAVTALATRDGKRDLVVCARAHAYELGDEAQTAAELAVRVVMDAKTNDLASLVVKRAPLHVERRAPIHPTRDYVASKALGDPDLGPRALALLARDIDAAVGAKKKTTDILLLRRPEGFVLDILRPGAIEGGLAYDGGRVVAVSHRQVKGDVIVWVPSRRRLRISTSDPALAALLRAKVGLRLWGDERALSAGPSVSLSPLRAMGSRALDASAFGASFKKVRLVRVVWDRGGDDVVVVRGRDVLASMAARRWSLATGHFVGAVIRLDLTHGGHVDVVLKPPNRVHFTSGPWDAAVAAWLDAGPFLALGVAPVDAWTQFAATMRDLEWRAEHGDAWVDRRRASGALVPAQTRVLPHPEFASATRALLAFYDDEDGGYAFAEDDDDDVPALVVTQTDLGAHRIEPQKYANEIASYVDGVLPAIGPSNPLALDAQIGLFDLRERRLGLETIRPFVALGPLVADGLGDRLREVAPDAHRVLLLPRGRTLGTGMIELAWPESAEEAHALVREIARAIGARGALPVHLAAPAGTRFAIDSVTKEACLDGIELGLTDQTFEFLLLLARTPRVAVSTQAVNDRIGRSRKDADAAKKAKSTLLARIRAAFEEAGGEPPSDLDALVTTGARGGYTLCVSVYVR